MKQTLDTSSFALRTDLASLKTEVDKLDVDKLPPVPVDLSKLRDVVTNDLVKKAVNDKLAVKVNNNDTTDFALKTKDETDKTELEKKIPNVTDFIKKIKLTELEEKISDVGSLVTKTALTVVENKIAVQLKKQIIIQKLLKLKKKLTDLNHDKHITTPEFNTLVASAFNARLPQANLITKADFDAKLSSLHRKVTSNKSKHLLVEAKKI